MNAPRWFDAEAFANPGGRIAIGDVVKPRPPRAPLPIRPDAPTAPVRTSHALDEFTSVRTEIERKIALMIPIAQELARQAGLRGIIVGDIRAAAADRGIITGHERGRTLSYLQRVPIAAGLVKLEGQKRRVDARRFKQSHANDHQVYLSPEFAR